MALKEIITATLTALLIETFEKVNGYYLDKGTSLFETLDTISAEEASRPVSATCAALSAQVAHVNFYLWLMLEYGAGRDPGKVDWGEIWRTVREVTPEEWDASRAQLRETYQRVRAFVDGIEDWEAGDRLEESISCIVHTAYHLGEIRQALCTLKTG